MALLVALAGAAALVRVERSGHRASRVYRTGFRATDASAASCAGQVFVVVLHDQAHAGVAPVPDGAWHDLTKPR